MAATEWVHHPTSARLKPRSKTADSRTARCGAFRKARPVSRPTSGVRSSAGRAIAAIEQRAVGGVELEMSLQPQVEPESPADETEAHREQTDGDVPERGDLPEPRERVQRGEVFGADVAVVVEDLFHFGATAAAVR